MNELMSKIDTTRTFRNEFISSRVYRDYLVLLSKLVDLPTAIILAYPGEKIKEYTIFHRMFLENYGRTDGVLLPTLKVDSYAVIPQGIDSDIQTTFSDGKLLVSIDPEYDFNQNGIFWACAPQRIFKDYMALNDKKYGKLSWCASYDRDLYFPTFNIIECEPLFSSSYPLEMLKLLDIDSAPAEEKPKATFVGSVDLDGNFIDAGMPKGANNTTVLDGPIDLVPAGAMPNVLSVRSQRKATFGESIANAVANVSGVLSVPA